MTSKSSTTNRLPPKVEVDTMQILSQDSSITPLGASLLKQNCAAVGEVGHRAVEAPRERAADRDLYRVAGLFVVVVGPCSALSVLHSGERSSVFRLQSSVVFSVQCSLAFSLQSSVLSIQCSVLSFQSSV